MASTRSKNTTDKNTAKGVVADTEIPSSDVKFTQILNKIIEIIINMNDIKTKFRAMHSKIDVVTVALGTITKNCADNENDIAKVNCRVEVLEQYTRRNNLRFLDIRECDYEKCR